MIFLAFVVAFVNSWSEESLIIAMEIMFRYLGDSGPNIVNSITSMTNERFERPSMAGAWLSYIERPPYNTDCFNHWRFSQKPIGETSIQHSNEDDLNSCLSNLLKAFSSGTLNGAWPINLGFRSFLTLYLENFSPLHNAEYFGAGFSDGDNGGKNFLIKYNGKVMSLYDYWESSCGRYTIELPYNISSWNLIDQIVTKLINDHSFSSYSNISTDIQLIQNNSYNIATNFVYQGVVPGHELSPSYIDQCISFCDTQLPLAAYSLGLSIKNLKFPSIPLSYGLLEITTSEVVGWVVMLFLLSLLGIVFWNFVQKKLKTD